MSAGMTVIGLTGPSGAGKSTVLRVFASLGAVTVDADAIYHELLSRDAELQAAIRSRFPQAFAAQEDGSGPPDGGTLDRKALGNLVYGDPASLRALEEITHPAVIAETVRILENARAGGAPAAAIDAIALLQSGMASVCDVTVAVLAAPDARLARIMARDGISRSYALRRMDAQPDDTYYAQRCDHILYNTEQPGALARRAAALYGELVTAGAETRRRTSGCPIPRDKTTREADA